MAGTPTPKPTRARLRDMIDSKLHDPDLATNFAGVIAKDRSQHASRNAVNGAFKEDARSWRNFFPWGKDILRYIMLFI